MAVWDRYTHDVAGMAAPLTDAGDFDALLDRVGQAQVVMLGEASHGTHEFYQWRASLTQRLVSELGFAFVAVEGDWPDCDRVDRSVRARPGVVGPGEMAGGAGTAAPEDPRAALGAFERWPTWMWANEEVVDFSRWLRRFNADREPGARVGFHGLDVYSLWESLRAVLLHLREHDPEAVEEALAAYRCFEPYGEDPQRYAMATRFVPEGCEDQVVDLLARMRERAISEGVRPGSDDELSAWQNAEVVAGADRYYRAMVQGNVESWNVRDRHMAETLDRLLAYYGPGAKAVVWAHNTHVGDARATDMADAGEVNIGQLARDRYGREKVVLIGFGCHRGTVVAGAGWGAPMQVMPVPAARNGSLEDILHDTAPEQALFVFPDLGPGGQTSDLLTDWLGHRAIGVVYHPERERWGNYVPTKLGDRYDAFLWVDQTRGVRPLRMREIVATEPETYPLGV